ncbi:MAG: GerMN domain-containing protein [Acetatifactor sp.]
MKRKRFYILLAAVLCSLLLAACGNENQENQNVYQVYYLNNGETKVEMHPHEMLATDEEGQLDELLECLSTNPEKLEYKAPFTMGFQVKGVSLDGGRLTIDVDENYLSLTVTTEVLVRAAIVRTLTQISNVNYVTITVEGNQLYDNMGNMVGWMNAEQFIDNDGNEINTYELTRVKLYFAGEDGTKLIAAFREKHYSTSTPLERFVVEELIAGPSGQVEGLYPSVNPATKIINVMTKDGICYVNLDENFLTVVNNVPTEVSVYSIVNSLVELSNINKVQILINGEVLSSFSTSTFERNLDIVTTLEK